MRVAFHSKILGVQLVHWKIATLPTLGKWSVVRHANPKALAAAEARWRGETPAQFSTEDRDQRAKRQIDDSRYEK